MARLTRPGVKAVQAAFVLAVFAALCLPLLARWLGPTPREHGTNLRAPSPAAWPPAPRRGADLRAWTRAVEDAVKSRLALRDAAIRGYYGFVYFLLHASPTQKVVRGRAGWLFYNSAEEPFSLTAGSIADARRSHPLGVGKVNVLAAMIRSRQELLSSWGGRYLFVVVPNKSSIYAEHLPKALTPVGLGKPLEQLGARLPPPPTGPFLDLTRVLLERKGETILYHKTDSHWTPPGALLGLIAIMTALATDHPGLRVPRPDEFAAEEVETRGFDLARMLRLDPLLREPTWHLRLKTAPALPAFQRRLRVWVYHDSFYKTIPRVWKAFLPALVAHPMNEVWSEDEVRAARPDVVIELFVERRLRVPTRRPAPFF